MGLDEWTYGVAPNHGNAMRTAWLITTEVD